jgi:hypothetical protein
MNFMARYFGVANSDLGRMHFPAMVLGFFMLQLCLVLQGFLYNDGLDVVECGGLELGVQHALCGGVAVGGEYLGNTVVSVRHEPPLWAPAASFHDELSIPYSFTSRVGLIYFFVYLFVIAAYSWWPKPDVVRSIQAEVDDLAAGYHKIRKEYDQHRLYVAERVTSKQHRRTALLCLPLSHFELGTVVIAVILFAYSQAFILLVYWDRVMGDLVWSFAFMVPGGVMMGCVGVILFGALHPALLAYYAGNLHVLLMEHCQVLDFARPKVCPLISILV